MGLRIWHWLNALVILGLLGTVLLRKTFLSWRTNSVYIHTKVTDTGGMIDLELAKEIAKGLRDMMWEWHIILGFALAALIVLRKVVAIVSKRLPPQEVLEGMRAVSKAKGKEKKDLIHYTAMKLSHVAFYLGLGFMTFTGLLIHYAKQLYFSKDTFGLLKESHEYVMWFILIFVVAHLTGVVIAELGHSRGIVSDMINGGEKGRR